MTAGYWWEVLFDALAIASLVVAVNLISDRSSGSSSNEPGHPNGGPAADTLSVAQAL